MEPPGDNKKLSQNNIDNEETVNIIIDISENKTEQQQQGQQEDVLIPPVPEILYYGPRMLSTMATSPVTRKLTMPVALKSQDEVSGSSNEAHIIKKPKYYYESDDDTDSPEIIVN